MKAMFLLAYLPSHSLGYLYRLSSAHQQKSRDNILESSEKVGIIGAKK